MNTSALTWAAAQAGETDWKFLSRITAEDEKKIEIAYAEWRARVTAGEKRPKVDWKAVVLPEPVEPAPVAPVEASPAMPAEPEPALSDDVDDPDVAEAVEQVEEILGEEQTEEYISLDDFNFEPSEAEMKAVEASIQTENKEAAVEGSVDEEDDVPGENVDAASEDIVDTMPEDDVAISIEQRISKLSKDADSAVYADLLIALAGDIDIAKSVTEAVIRDQTRRHRGTAAQRQFLAWLSTEGGEERE